MHINMIHNFWYLWKSAKNIYIKIIYTSEGFATEILFRIYIKARFNHIQYGSGMVNDRLKIRKSQKKKTI